MRYSFIADKKVQGCIAPAMVSDPDPDPGPGPDPDPDTGRDRNSGMREALAVLRPGDSFYAEGIACPYYAVAACVPDLFAPPLRVNVLPLPGVVAVR